MFPPKPLDIFSPEGGCSEGLDAFRFFLNRSTETYFYLAKNENVYAISDRNKTFRSINISALSVRHCGPRSSTMK